MRVKEMGHWPGTPGIERLELADQLIMEDLRQEQENPEHTAAWDRPGGSSDAYDDVRMVLDYTEIWFFSMGAHEEVVQLDDAEQINSNIDLLEVAGQGSDEKFIGMVLDRGEPPEDDPDDAEGDYGIILSCLYRNAGWVGLNEQLQWCRGLEIHVYCYRGEPEDPCVIIGVRPGNMVGAEDAVQPAGPQGGLNEAIQEVVLYHGATKCVWHTRKRERPTAEPDAERENKS